MKKTLLLSTALPIMLATAQAFAADLPALKGPPAPPPPPLFTWTGFHVGFNHGLGGGVVDANVNLFGPAIFANTTTTNRVSGFEGGLEAGYDYQFANNLLVGLETDIQWSDIKASHQATTFSTLGLAGYTYADIHNSLKWFGTTRARIGYAFGRVLPYVTGGVAYGEMQASGVQTVGGAVFAGSGRETKVGWTVGAGIDYALSDSLSARAEYLYVQLPGIGGPALGALPAPLPVLVGNFTTGSFGAHMIRTGINYKFGGGLPSFGNVWGMLFEPATVDWSGFYAGVEGGYGGDLTNATVALASPLPVASTTHTVNHTGGFLAGGQAGYNFQATNHIVIGVETDAQWSDIKASHQAAAGPGAVAITDISNGVTWFGTTRARLGWAAGSTLAYLTGGVAYGEVTARGSQIAGGLFAGSTSQTKIGWTGGAGAEYALSDRLSLKAEYLYVSFDGVRGSAIGVLPAPLPPVVGAFSTGTFGAHVARVGLNWRFNAGAPVIAKY